LAPEKAAYRAAFFDIAKCYLTASNITVILIIN
jgi:hypothetical protein